ncbi:MAG TPA: hypothetical protein VL856_05100, partial [Acidimicrobiia bacterium]|nr:hypothetical protein [Acidimicrobiia bacterium]
GPGWAPAANCDLGSSNAPVLADNNGRAVFQPTDPNHAITPFKGESPQSLFNCLSSHEAPLSPSNGLPDFTNCKIRVSTNNVAVTGDQQFFDVSLPDAAWEGLTVSAGSCTGAKVLGKWATPGLTNTAAAAKFSSSLLKDTTNPAHPALSGTCGVPTIGTLHPKAWAFALKGTTKCGATALDAPITGTLTITMSETYTNPVTLALTPYKIQAFVRRTPAVDAAAPDVSLYQGVLTKGIGPNAVDAGATIVGTLFEDPVTKNVKPVVTQTGYTDAHTKLTQCAAGAATLDTVLVGDGTSAFGGTGSGLVFGY